METEIHSNFMRNHIFIFATVGATQVLSASVLMIEDFEDSTVNYSTTAAEGSDGAQGVFARISPGGFETNASVTGALGLGYFAAQDTDDADAAGVSPASLNFTGISIASYNNLSFSGLFAEDDDAANQDWDSSDFVHVYATIDSGTPVLIFAIENDGSTFNTAPQVDTDFDGTGDGAEITSTFTSYSGSIAGTGSILDLEIRIGLNARDEDIAFDQIQISGDFVVPEPSSALFGSLALFGFLRRKR